MDKKKKPKYAKPTKSKLVPTLVTVAAVLAVVLIALALFVKGRADNADSPVTDRPGLAPSADGKGSLGKNEEQKGLAESTVPTVNTLQFPYTLENGSLEISSLFQYSGMNPDFENATGDNIGAIELVNRSQEFLSSVEIVLDMADGSQLRFLAADIPAGQTAWVFADGNGSYAAPSVGCLSASCTAQFAGEVPVPQGVDISVQGMDVTITNNTAQELPAMEVSCHCLFSDVYFGGRVYIYSTEPVAPGQSVSLTAFDCYLGDAVPVRVEPAG